jgi:hypothetical protein
VSFPNFQGHAFGRLADYLQVSDYGVNHHGIAVELLAAQASGIGHDL